MKKIIFACLIFLSVASLSFAQDLWQKTAGPNDGSFVRTLLTSKTGTVYAGTSKGVHRTMEDGTSWQLIGLSNKVIYSLAEDDEGNIYAGSNDGNIYKSTNQGILWQPAYNTNGNILVLGANKLGHIFAGSWGGTAANSGLFISSDNGTSFQQLGLSFLMISDICFDSLNNIYVCGYAFDSTQAGIWKSTDNGINWNTINSGLIYRSTIYSLAYSSNGYLLAGSAGYSGIYKSVDFGNNWSII